MKRTKAITGMAATAFVVAAMSPGTAMAATTPLVGPTHGVTLNFMIASSGPAETSADKAAATAWGKKTGNKVNVINSSNLTERLTEAFAGGSPPDIFYGETPMFESMVKQDQLLESGNLVYPAKDFYPSLVQEFSYNHQFYCVPKDSSTLAIEINVADWKAAGLTNANLPTTWAKLAYDAKALTRNGVTGLVLSNTLDRLGAFFKEAGGSYMNAAGTKFTFDSPQNLEALKYIQGLAMKGYLKFSPQVDAGWGGEAFGTGRRQLDHRRHADRLPEDPVRSRAHAGRPWWPPWHPGLHQLLGYRCLQQVHGRFGQLRPVPGVAGPAVAVRQRVRRDALAAGRGPAVGGRAREAGRCQRQRVPERFCLRPG
jgi:ABC-type glycerol-3-phosphate transport system substrate-binding protein